MSDAGEIITDGHNVIRDDLMGGNQELYDITKLGLNMAAGEIVYLADMYNSLNSGSSKTTTSNATADVADDDAMTIGGSGVDDVGKGSKTYQTYTKYNSTTGETYSGRTSGTGTPIENVTKRDANHHMNSQGFGPAKLDMSSPDYDAIRGRKQMLIDYYGGAKSTGGTSGNAINGIGINNKNKDIYINAAKGAFGGIE